MWSKAARVSDDEVAHEHNCTCVLDDIPLMWRSVCTVAAAAAILSCAKSTRWVNIVDGFTGPLRDHGDNSPAASVLVSDNVAFDIAWLDHELLSHGICDRPLSYAFCAFDSDGTPGAKRYRQARSVTDLKKGVTRKARGWVSDDEALAAVGAATGDYPDHPSRGIVHDHRAVNDAHRMCHVAAVLYRACGV